MGVGALGRRLRRLDVRALRGRPLEEMRWGEVRGGAVGCRRGAVWSSQGSWLFPRGRWVVLTVREGPGSMQQFGGLS